MEIDRGMVAVRDFERELEAIEKILEVEVTLSPVFRRGVDMLIQNYRITKAGLQSYEKMLQKEKEIYTKTAKVIMSQLKKKLEIDPEIAKQLKHFIVCLLEEKFLESL